MNFWRATTEGREEKALGKEGRAGQNSKAASLLLRERGDKAALVGKGRKHCRFYKDEMAVCGRRAFQESGIAVKIK